jgi:exonuclease VII small subunit
MSIQTKLETLTADLQQAVNTYNQAAETLAVTKDQILSLQGAIQALQDLTKEEPTEEE